MKNNLKKNNSSIIESLSVDQIEFKTLAEDAPVMLWLANSAGKNIFSNTRWQTFIGSEKVTQMGGNAWVEALHPDDKEKCLEIFTEAFQSHKPFEMEYRLKRRDGEWRFVLDSGEPYIDKKGKFAGFIGSSTDITDRKLHEEKLRISHQEMHQHNIEMGVINQLNAYLQVCRTMDETYPVITNYAAKLFPGCPGALYLFNENKTMVEAVVRWGKLRSTSHPVISPDDCWALRQGKPHLVDGIDTMMSCKHLDKKLEHGYACVPIIAQGDMLGMLHIQYSSLDAYVSSGDKKRKIESRQRLVDITADNLALSLMSLKLREALKNQSIRDPLTQLYNRRYMEDNLERELSRCQRKKTALGLILLDIDHFKKINDSCGHDVGDRVIQEMGCFLNEQFRESDIVCRFGGEEFVVILPEIDEGFLSQRAEKVRQGIKQLVIDSGTSHQLGPVTVSIGIATFPDHGNNNKELFKAADIALYEAKNNGRDQVKIATSNSDRRRKAFNSKPDKPLKIAKG